MAQVYDNVNNDTVHIAIANYCRKLEYNKQLLYCYLPVVQEYTCLCVIMDQ